MLQRWFTAHPREVGESYIGHQRIALGFAGAMFRGACACFIHALVPGMFETTASRCVERLHREMRQRGRMSIRVQSQTPDGSGPAETAPSTLRG